MAFSTSSSNATLPLTIETAEEKVGDLTASAVIARSEGEDLALVSGVSRP